MTHEYKEVFYYIRIIPTVIIAIIFIIIANRKQKEYLLEIHNGYTIKMRM